MSEQNVEQSSDLVWRKKRKVKREAKSPLNDTSTNNDHVHIGTQVSLRKGSAKGKHLRCLNKTNNKTINNSNSNKIVKVIKVQTVQQVQRTLVSAFWTLIKTHLL